MYWQSDSEVQQAARGIVETAGPNGPVEVIDADRLQTGLIDRLALEAAVAPDDGVRRLARRLIGGAAAPLGIRSASIRPLYDARGRGEVGGFTVPAINIRGLTYEVARAIFRARRAEQADAVVFEIARSEIGYTEQRPSEYTAMVLAAAIREGYRGPVFLQGDHFQVKASAWQQDPAKEVGAVKDLIREAIEAQFFNIDIDTSTLVDLSRPTLTEQQRPNFEVGADLSACVRELEPEGVSISIGGEIGEVGTKNSTLEELHAYMEGFNETLANKAPGAAGVAKVSVQSGTSHGGVVLPDGSVARVSIDFDTLREMSTAARERYGMAGAVQHGASTLPEEAFDRFPVVECADIHLATEFQNMIYENESFPADLRDAIYAHLDRHHADEKKDGWTREQFLYKTRKKAFGPFKERINTLPAEVRESIGRTLEAKFVRLFRLLKVSGTAGMIAEQYPAQG